MRKVLLMLISLICLVILTTSCYIGDESWNCRGICYGCWYGKKDAEIAAKDPSKYTTLKSGDYEIIDVEAVPSQDEDYFNRQCIKLYGQVKFYEDATDVTIMINVMLGDSIMAQYETTLEEVSAGKVHYVNTQLPYNVYYESGELNCLVEVRGKKDVQ